VYEYFPLDYYLLWTTKLKQEIWDDSISASSNVVCASMCVHTWKTRPVLCVRVCVYTPGRRGPCCVCEYVCTHLEDAARLVSVESHLQVDGPADVYLLVVQHRWLLAIVPQVSRVWVIVVCADVVPTDTRMDWFKQHLYMQKQNWIGLISTCTCWNKIGLV